mgnify:CR=1 FL=1
MDSIRKKIDELLAEKRVAERNITSLTSKLGQLENQHKELIQAQTLFQSATKIMYQNLSSKLGDIVTEGLSIIFPESNYTFIIEFVERRGTIEADLYLEDEKGNRLDPLSSTGGGVVDIISMLLRCTYIILSKYDNVLIADEPMRFVDRDRIPESAAFLRKICDDFGLQAIVVTHIPEITEQSESVFYVKKENGISRVKQIK